MPRRQPHPDFRKAPAVRSTRHRHEPALGDTSGSGRGRAAGGRDPKDGGRWPRQRRESGGRGDREAAGPRDAGAISPGASRDLPERVRLERGDQLVPRRWRQWYARSLEVEGTPLEVKQPKRRQWGRRFYLAIVIVGVLAGLNYVAGHVFWYTGQGVVGGRQYQLSPTAVSVVKKIDVKPGDHVRKGQMLVSFSSPQLNQELAQVESNIVTAESQNNDHSATQRATAASLRAEISGLKSQYATLQQQYNSQEQQVDSLRKLAAQGALNFGDADSLQQQALQTKAQASGINAKIQADRAQLRELRITGRGHLSSKERVAALEKLRRSLRSTMDAMDLRAPIDGVVTQVPATEGQTLKPGDPAVVVAPKGDRRTLLYFPPAADSQLSQNKIVPVTTPDGRTIRMRITHIYPSVQDLPKDLQNTVGDNHGRKIIAVAKPVNPKDVNTLQVGTPVSVSVHRWKSGQWISRWGHAMQQWISQHLKQIG